MTTMTYSNRKVAVTTTKKSHANTALAWFLKNVAQRLAPRVLTWCSLRHVLAYCARRDPDPQFDQQLVGDPLFAPHVVLGGHSTNQRPQFYWNRRSTQFALESPKQSLPRSVPACDHFRTHGYDCVLPIEQTGEEREADPRYRINPSGL
jgi:hypothetical protein